MSDPLLRIRNRHSAACNDPPFINNDDSRLYIGYFENSCGEQWVFTFNEESRTAELRGGDIGWNEVHLVIHGRAVGLSLNGEEATWLEACWRAAMLSG